MSPTRLQPGFIVRNTFIDVDEPWEEGDEGCPSPHRRNASAPPSPSRSRRGDNADEWLFEAEDSDKECVDVPDKMTFGQLAVECRRERPQLAQTLLQRQGDSCEAWSPLGSPKKVSVKNRGLGNIFNAACDEQDMNSEQKPRGLCDVFCDSTSQPAPSAPPGSSCRDLTQRHAEFVTPSPPPVRPFVPETMWSTPECPPPPQWSSGGPGGRGRGGQLDGSLATGVPPFQPGDCGTTAQKPWGDPSPDFWALGQQRGRAPPHMQGAPTHKLASLTPGAPAVQPPRSTPGVPPGIFVVSRPAGSPQQAAWQPPPSAPHRGAPGASGADADARLRLPQGLRNRLDPPEPLPVGRLGLLAGQPRLGREGALMVQPPAAVPSAGRTVAPR
eukprot:CAMPEP_0170228244 /NCGR_PEP_ID=MMETSP0116_2-20130129/13840_1 /TAXON_ID=400756 /ORGANISM="Durinskia baltica, Strain CSIRO CS-38" /LENGTH=384 /DNA_ID=CAMNT_0010478983 /DNA_START=286 /DNA_END=1440 /DNA_ORIENTATION=+